MNPAQDTDPHAATPAGQPRARSLGIPFGGQPGRWNAITDVPGVEVGYATLIQGQSVRTGVTAIHPRGDMPRAKLYGWLDPTLNFSTSSDTNAPEANDVYRSEERRVGKECQ